MYSTQPISRARTTPHPHSSIRNNHTLSLSHILANSPSLSQSTALAHPYTLTLTRKPTHLHSAYRITHASVAHLEWGKSTKTQNKRKEGLRRQINLWGKNDLKVFRSFVRFSSLVKPLPLKSALGLKRAIPPFQPNLGPVVFNFTDI